MHTELDIKEATVLLEHTISPSGMAEDLIKNRAGVFYALYQLSEQSKKYHLYEGLAMSCFKLGLYLGYQQAELERLDK